MAEKIEAIEVGEFQVRGLDIAGGEVRLSDESSQSNIVIRKKSVVRGMERGRTFALTLTPLPPAEDPGRVVVEVPADEVEGMSSNAKIIEDAGTRKKDKK